MGFCKCIFSPRLDSHPIYAVLREQRGQRGREWSHQGIPSQRERERERNWALSLITIPPIVCHKHLFALFQLAGHSSLAFYPLMGDIPVGRGVRSREKKNLFITVSVEGEGRKGKGMIDI